MKRSPSKGSRLTASSDRPAEPAPPNARSNSFVLAVMGPTASGKTALAEALARRIGGEVVSADSMQVYRGMDIGTAKPPLAERTVPYHCLDLVEPGESYSAARYQADARYAIDDILTRGLTPVVAGGTGLYVRAALDDLTFPYGDTDAEPRRRYETLAEELGPEGLHELLAERDPASAALIHPNNVRRTVRALEMHDEGVSYAEQAAGFSRRKSEYPTLFLGLDIERDELYERIDERVDGMLAKGLVDEVRVLLERGYGDAMTATQAIGYKELVGVVEGRAELGKAAEEIKRATRRYAKRQLTWFRADPRIVWLDVTRSSAVRTLSEALELVESFERGRGPAPV